MAIVIFLSLMVLAVGCDRAPKTSAESAKSVPTETVKPKKDERSNRRPAAGRDGTRKTRITLYFGDETGSKLVKEIREVPETSEPARAVIEGLIQGPAATSSSPVLPAGTRLNAIRIVDETAEVDFSRELVDDHPGGSSGERLTVYSVVDSLTEFSTIRAVKFLVDGRSIETIGGHMDLSGPLSRDEGLL